MHLTLVVITLFVLLFIGSTTAAAAAGTAVSTDMPQYSDEDPFPNGMDEDEEEEEAIIDPAAAARTRFPTKRPTQHPTKTPTNRPTTVQPSHSPTLSPTPQPTQVACSSFSAQSSCLKQSARCEWITASAAASGKGKPVVTYGCQQRGYCNLNKGANRKQQCKSRSKHCTWSGNKCASLCPATAPFKLAAMVDYASTCKQLNLVDSIAKSKASKLEIKPAINQAHFGDAVAGGGQDFDGDGKPDYAVGAPDLPPKTSPDRDGTGGVYLYLSSTGSNSKPLLITGTSLEGQFGSAIAFVDLDADGLADLVVGAPHSGIRTGEVYVIWGRPDFATQHAKGAYNDLLAVAASKHATRLPGPAAQATFGSALAPAGDFNGDGVPDLIIAAKSASVKGRAYCGQVSVVLGSKNRASIGGAVFRVTGKDAIAYFGSAVSGGRDLNRDGYADIIVGAPWADAGAGKAYIVFGRAVVANNNNELDLQTHSFLLQPSGRWNYAQVSNAAAAADEEATSNWANFGHSVSLVGDVNVDGQEDFAVGAPGHDSKATGQGAGKVYVFVGSRATNPVAVLPHVGFAIEGSSKGAKLGYSLGAAVVDFNGDGYADILIGAPGTNKGKGAAIVVYGQCRGFPNSTTLRVNHNKNAAGSVAGTVFTHPASSQFGTSLTAAGDVNGDGRTDLVIGAPQSSGSTQHGLAEIVYSC